MPTITRQRKFYPSVNQRLMGYIKRLPNLVAYYPLNEDSGAVAYNHAPATKGSNDGAITGATVKQDGHIGKSYNFDGTDDKIDGFSIVMPTSWTIVFLLKPNTQVATWGAILVNSSGSNGLYLLNNRKISFYNGGDKLSTGTLTNDVWNLGIVTNNAGSLTFYINGVADGTSAGGTNYTATNIGNDTESDLLKGNLQHLAVLSRVLSADEIERINNIAGF